MSGQHPGSDELEELFAAAREERPASADVNSIRATLGTRLNTPMPSQPWHAWPKVLGALGLGVGVLLMVAWLLQPAPQAPPESPGLADPPSPADVTRREQADEPPPPITAEVADPTPEPAPVEETIAGRADPSPTRAPVPSEEALLARAQDALPTSPASALRWTRRHAQLYPDGVLSQERELLAVEALTGLRRMPAARARADGFARRWPSSAHLPRIQRLVTP